MILDYSMGGDSTFCGRGEKLGSVLNTTKWGLRARNQNGEGVGGRKVTERFSC